MRGYWLVSEVDSNEQAEHIPGMPKKANTKHIKFLRMKSTHTVFQTSRTFQSRAFRDGGGQHRNTCFQRLELQLTTGHPRGLPLE